MDRATLGYRLASGVARGLPGPVADIGTRMAATTAIAITPERRFIVERNLKRVLGDDIGRIRLRRLVQRTFEYYARYWVESFRLPGTAPADIDAGFSSEGYRHVHEARERGIGPIMAIPHMGGWEWAAFWLATTPRLPITAVVEPPESEELFEWFVEFRESLGMNVVPLGPSAGTEVIRAIKARHVVCLLCDRDISGGGVEVEFFGERTTLPGGPATLALRTGAPLLPTAVYYKGSKHHAVVQEPLPAEREGRLRDDVARVTQDLARALEGLIRAAPEQWHLMQPNWPSDHEALERFRQGPAWSRGR